MLETLCVTTVLFVGIFNNRRGYPNCFVMYTNMPCYAARTPPSAAPEVKMEAS
jgi:hypothetical protein